MAKKVLVVDGGQDGLSPEIPELEVTGIEFQRVGSVKEAGEFFDGRTELMDFIVLGNVSGAPEFVRRIKNKLPWIKFIGLSEHRAELANLGCSVFVQAEVLPLTLECFVNI